MSGIIGGSSGQRIERVKNSSALLTVLTAGEHTAVTTGGSPIVLDCDNEVYFVDAAETGAVGLDLDSTAHLAITAGGVSGFAGLDFGGTNAPISFFMWGEVDANTANGPRPIFLGASSGSAKIEIQTTITGGSSPYTLNVRVIIDDDTDINVLDITQALDTSYLLGTKFSLAFTIDRVNSEFKSYYNGNLIDVDSFTDTANDIDCAVAASQVRVGSTIGGANNWTGRLYDLQIYKVELTDQEVLRRHALGPGTPVFDDGINPSARVNFNARADWADPDVAELIDSTGTAVATFSVLGGGSIDFDTDLNADSFGKIASPAYSRRCKAGQEMVLNTAGVTTLNVWSAQGGNLWITTGT